MCNRPENESEDQPDNRLLEETCQRAGLSWHYLPAEAGNVTDANVAEFATLMNQVQGPVLAYCRTGTRSATLWALSQAPRLDVAAILTATAQAGYDLAPRSSGF
ncbi:TIGR01244 family sulfur transferase [Aliamphritea spongicola]|nr:TIGR01244 family sulfur transferase [Aliamphritea spongicola]